MACLHKALSNKKGGNMSKLSCRLSVIILILTIMFAPLVSNASFLEDQFATFYVIFNDKPKLTEDKVYARGFVIGEILSQELSPNLKVVLKIQVQAKYAQAITECSAFYAFKGRLIYGDLCQEGKVLSPGSKVLGFTSKQAFLAFKIKHCLEDIATKAREKVEELWEGM